MRLLVQRVKKANVMVDNTIISSIEKGLLVFVGFHKEDKDFLLAQATKKLLSLRIFADCEEKMDKSIKDIEGELLIVSQFTLYADTHKGNRPSFVESAPYEKGKALYDEWIAQLKKESIKVRTGQFGANMAVTLTNDGPVTIWLDFPSK